MLMDSCHKKVLKHLDEEKLINLTKRLISIPSYHDMEEPEREISNYIYNYLRDEGLNRKCGQG